MTIRELRPADFDDVLETYLSFFPEAEADPSFGLLLFREQPTVENERKWFDDTLREVRDGNAVMRVAEVDSHVVGWCDVRRTRPGTPRDHRGLLGICVRNAFRGRGLGTALLGEVLQACRGRFEAVELSVLSTNPGAFELYTRFGFREVGVMPGAIKRAGVYIDERMMQLKL